MKRKLIYTSLVSLLAATAFIQPAGAVEPGAGTAGRDGARAADPAYENAKSNTAGDANRMDRSAGTTSDSYSGSSSRSSTSAMSDAAITAKVKSALLAERDLPSTQIKVQTNDGIVQLSGFLGTQDEIDRAISVARNVDDVKAVENNIQMKSDSSDTMQDRSR